MSQRPHDRSRRRVVATVAALALAAGVAACSDHEFHPPDEEERLIEAEALYEEARFDTVRWTSDAERVQAGNLVYADECRRCHGPLGRGETDYVHQNDLDVPSLVDPEWELADDLEGLRRRVFVGHPAGMPNWGVGSLTERQIDAAAFYILEQLRPEILNDSLPAAAPTS